MALALPALLLCAATLISSAGEAPNPPPVAREFRGVWVATVNNIDWPSKPGLSTTAQKGELIAILDTAVKLNLNAIILQVRPAGDVFYQSSHEPWSPFITGKMGGPPQPFYDPLQFAIDEAHKRGLELHAWVNPFRASHPAFIKSRIAITTNHVSRSHPEWVKKYGALLWLDPGEPSARRYVLENVMELVNRYDIDGLQFDDYFYPYAEKDAHGKNIEFPDDASWRRFGAPSKLSRADWRRENINQFIHGAYTSIKAAKPWVKFGVAPFGIWQPGFPPQIRGKNSYDEVYADSRKWLREGWLDYFAPQLYWRTSDTGQSFPVLLQWWAEQNVLHRNLWPGLAASNVGDKWKSTEIIDQIERTRRQANASGDIIYDVKTLMENRDGLAVALKTNVYAEPALVPASPWLEPHSISNSPPTLTIERQNHASWEPSGASPRIWTLQTHFAGRWHTQILPSLTRGFELIGSPDAVALTPIDRYGIAGPAAVAEIDVAPQGQAH